MKKQVERLIIYGFPCMGGKNILIEKGKIFYFFGKKIYLYPFYSAV